MKSLILILVVSGAIAHGMQKTCSMPDLHNAVFHAKVELAAKYLQEKHDPNARTRTGKTTIHFAALSDAADFEKIQQICFELKKYDVNLNAQDDRGFTALHIAAAQERYDLINFFIELGINPLITDKDGYTPAGFSMMTTNKPALNEYLNKKWKTLVHK